MKYSTRDNRYKVSFPIDITDETLIELIVTIQREFMDVKFAYLDSEIEKYRAASDVAELEREEVV
jgi:cytidylate kinase